MAELTQETARKYVAELREGKIGSCQGNCAETCFAKGFKVVSFDQPLCLGVVEKLKRIPTFMEAVREAEKARVQSQQSVAEKPKPLTPLEQWRKRRGR
jgi:hypothetical protein